ncbi:hypothetical protein K437DRAFT_172734 [Tilletiaria anomala UBC 951]|uniref:Ima1 N-terminal domain-containing protein n=1 Tax=Tilletiaria anomala (strain ATCC 24038 / CBS 436.72 / UBC 951) TaxID=1037660 RepID=A0A066VSH6_TILAU|nr:uncharacterized protein K437DRAFT_172734 [Tilletiaria anomala UBC 951]KDN41520.1 hypothetical protein K437DRAFT_172734 [Tilletiaria anomala UBC 951]
MAATWQKKMLRRLFSFSKARGVYPVERCFFCQTSSLVVPANSKLVAGIGLQLKSKSDTPPAVSAGTPDAWFCSACECWNGVEALGNIAHQNGSSSSSSKPRKFAFAPAQLAKGAAASPPSSRSSDSASATASSSPFCRACHRNQTLILHLLSNYLPENASQGPQDDEEDEKDTRLMSQLPAYRTTLEARYPPLCEACAQVAEDRILEADQDARKRLMSGWFERSGARKRSLLSTMSGNGVEAKGKGTLTGRNPNKAADTILHGIERTESVWKIRGALWILTQGCSLLLALASFSDRTSTLSREVRRWNATIFWFQITSILWSAWDPTWRTGIVERRRPGRTRSVRGRGIWARSQIFCYLLRLVQLLVLSEKMMGTSQNALDFIIEFRKHLKTSSRLGKHLLEEGYERGFAGPLYIGEQTVTARWMAGTAGGLDDTLSSSSGFETRFSLGIVVLHCLITIAAFCNLRIERTPVLSLASRRLGTVSSAEADAVSNGRGEVTNRLAAASSPVVKTANSGFAHWSGTRMAPHQPATPAQPAPVFGESSLPGAASVVQDSWAQYPSPRVPASDNGEAEPDEMDWQAEHPGLMSGGSRTVDLQHAHAPATPPSYIAPQRYFAPETPTGLEYLFGTALAIDAASASSAFGLVQGRHQRWTHLIKNVVITSLLSACMVMLVGSFAWAVQRAIAAM